MKSPQLTSHLTEKVESPCSEIRNKVTVLCIVLEDKATAIRQEREIRGVQVVKEEVIFVCR